MNNSKLANMKLPTAIFVRGLPGSGKSYLAAALLQALGEELVVMLDPDATDYSSPEYHEHTQKLTAEGVDPKLHAYRYLRGKAYDGIAADKIIIWNQPFTNLDIFNAMVGRLRDCAAEHGRALPILVVEVEIDPELAKARVTQRKQEGGHGPSDNTLLQRIKDYRSYANEGYDAVTVLGSDDVAVSVASVEQALRNLWAKS